MIELEDFKSTYLQNHHGEKIYVSQLGELVDQVLWQEVDYCVLRSHDLIANE